MKKITILQLGAFLVTIGIAITLPTGTNATLVAQWIASDYAAGVWTNHTGNSAYNGVYEWGTPTVVPNATPLGKPALDFQFYLFDQQSLSLASDLTLTGFTVVAVMRLDNGGQGPRILGYGNGTGLGYYGVDANGHQVINANWGGLGTGSATLSATDFSIISVTATQEPPGGGVVGNLRVNSANDGTVLGFSGTDVTFNKLVKGDGQFAEIRVYNEVLSPTALAQVESQLQGVYLSIPEPSTVLLFGVGAATMWTFRRRMKRK